MKNTILLFAIICGGFINAQIFSGQIFLRDNSALYLNQIYVTNLNEQKTILTNFNGEFNIQAKVGDVIRFTSIVTDRKDVQITNTNVSRNNNLIELKVAYTEIQEILVRNFKPTGNLRTDVGKLKSEEKALAIAKIIGLPEPKGDGNPPTLPVLGLSGGLALNVESLYDVISGERKKKERYYAYEKMNQSIILMKDYFGEEYFKQIKIPKALIDNFLQFVYSSDNIGVFVQSKNFETIKVYIEKYLPIYLKRLQNSNLASVSS